MRYLPDREPSDWLKIVWHETKPEPPKPRHQEPQTKPKYHLPTHPGAQLRLLKLLGYDLQSTAEVNLGKMPGGCRKKR